MHTVTPDDCSEAEDAIRDILLMYVDMIQSYAGFGHAVDVAIRFDPLKFVDAEVDACDLAPWIDLDLLRTGSAVAVLCRLYDLWCEFEAVAPFGQQYKQAIEEGRLRFAPDIESVAREALRRDAMTIEDPWFDEAVAPIYRRHVLGYFERLLANGHSPACVGDRSPLDGDGDPAIRSKG